MWNWWRKVKSTPEQQWMKNGDIPTTPDSNKLLDKEFWYLFAYGDQTGGFRHQLKDSIRVCPAFTDENDLILWNKKAGKDSEAIALKWEDSISPAYKNTKINGRLAYPKGRVKGELYLVPTYLYFKLDLDKQNGVQFRRGRVPILIPSKVIKRPGALSTQASYREWVDVNPVTSEESIQKLEAWMYCGNIDYWRNHLKGFEFRPVRSYEPEAAKVKKLLGDYYCYSFKEYRD